MLDYGEENFRFFLVGNWQILRKQRKGHLRDKTMSLETRNLGKDGSAGDGTAVLELMK